MKENYGICIITDFKMILKPLKTAATIVLKRNYVKTAYGLSAGIFSAITAVTLLEYINSKNNKPINHL
jgi:hypothetical protein